MIVVPEREIRGDVYGIYGTFSKYAGCSELKLKYGWQHGWVPSYLQINPHVVAGFCFDKDKYKEGALCVALESQSEYLKGFGYNSIPIGHPIVYFDLRVPEELKRKKNTVLIVPAHGFTNEDSDGFYDFECVNEIIQKHPDKNIYVLAHQHDYELGKYKKYEEKVGIVKGALMEDANTFLRIKFIFSQFDYVCFGSFTSAIIYASLFGSKCFLANNYFMPNELVYLKTQKWACGSLAIAKKFNDDLGRKEILKRYKFVGDCLENAGFDFDISRRELGYHHKLDPLQARELIHKSQSFDRKNTWLLRKLNGLSRRLGISIPFSE